VKDKGALHLELVRENTKVHKESTDKLKLGLLVPLAMLFETTCDLAKLGQTAKPPFEIA
jgi:hypothetical protein